MNCPSASPARPPSRVLIVDDNPQACEPLARLLKRIGVSAICVTSGAEALARLAVDVPALMILDVMMPGMDGMEVLTRVRQDPRTAALPVIMFSAITDRDFQAAALRRGANAFWVKASLDSRTIRRAIEQLLDRIEGGSPTP